MSQSAVDIENLSRSYGRRPALAKINLQVREGLLFGILGPNGGGKTTLFRILSSLLLPSEGSARIFGVDVADNPRRVRRLVGIIFQDPALDDELTVGENLMMHAALHGMAKRRARERMSELLGLFELRERESDRVAKLSGGLKRRADLVRGLLHSPAVLLLDEPTAGLDPAARQTFWEIVGRLRRRESITLLVATHVMEEADRCDELAIIDRGSLVAVGTPLELKTEVGTETLWIETDDPVALARDIKTHFGVSTRVVGMRIQVSHPSAHTLLASLYEVHEDRIRSAMVRRPTLEDVFMVHAGRSIEDFEIIEPEPQSR